MNHSTSWEDAGTAGFRCPDKGGVDDAGVVSAGEPTTCPVCGTIITLIWNVSLKEEAPKL